MTVLQIIFMLIAAAIAMVLLVIALSASKEGNTGILIICILFFVTQAIIFCIAGYGMVENNKTGNQPSYTPIVFPKDTLYRKI